jgi:Transposase IS66 family
VQLTFPTFRWSSRKISAHFNHKTAMTLHLTILNQRWAAFTRFIDDGRVCLTDNAAERALRGVAVGRKNWTFAGSDERASYCPSGYLLINQALPGTDCETPDDGTGDSLPLSGYLPAGDRRFLSPKALPYRVVQPAEARC